MLGVYILNMVTIIYYFQWQDYSKPNIELVNLFLDIFFLLTASLNFSYSVGRWICLFLKINAWNKKKRSASRTRLLQMSRKRFNNLINIWFKMWFFFCCVYCLVSEQIAFAYDTFGTHVHQLHKAKCELIRKRKRIETYSISSSSINLCRLASRFRTPPLAFKIILFKLKNNPP